MVARTHTRLKRGSHDGRITTWVVEHHAGVEVSIARIEKAAFGQCQAQFKVNGGAVILVVEGVLGNNGSLFGAGTLICFRDGETFAPVNSNPKSECWYAVLWFAQPSNPPP